MGNGKTHTIAVLPGDGIGVEVIAEAVATLKHATDLVPGFSITMEEYPWPSCAWYDQHGRMAPADFLDTLKQYDTLLLGALGDPRPEGDPRRIPDGISLRPLLDIRQGFQLWSCERPAVLYEGTRRYLSDPRAADVDMLVIRENSEGEYCGFGRIIGDESAMEISVHTRAGTERIIRHAFHRAAQRREGRTARPEWHDKQAQVCLVTKRNAQKYVGEFLAKIFYAVAAEFPAIDTHHELIDAAAMKFVTCPWIFDVVVGTNLFGDILTDLAAILCGGMGVAPSCNINPSDRSFPAMFEPTHGSAPDIAGQGLADPVAMLLTTAMMLEYLGETDRAAADAATLMRRAVRTHLRERVAANPVRTAAVGRDIRERMARDNSG